MDIDYGDQNVLYVQKSKYIAVKKQQINNIIFNKNNICEICNSIDKRTVFDHSKETNNFRGNLCNSCNRSLGVFGDNINGMINVINYFLKKEKKTIIQNKNGILELIN